MNSRPLVLLLSSALLAAPKLPVGRVIFGDVELILGESTFEQVARRLGPAPIENTGDAGESRHQACYSSPGPARASYYLESDEMGGGERITEFEAIAAGAATAAEDSLLARNCRTLTKSPRVRTDRGVALGQARADVERRLGGRGRDSAGVVIYSGSQVRRAKDYRATAWSYLRLRYLNGRLVAFAAGAGISD